jgi:hypothetical protein
MTQSALQRRLIRLAGAINAKAIRLGAPGRVSAESLYLIINAHPICPYCGNETDPMHGSFDHVVPFDKGGTNERSNIVFGHLSCNRRKFTKSTEEHMAFETLFITCPIDKIVFKPRYADWIRGLGRYCSRSCSAASRWRDA